ncbi:MAG TPA: portal protein, partial [Reyranellaceae bacterium]|nr:portal protein [Reyranellaceae bacterium]
PRGLYGRKPFASFWVSTKGKAIVERGGFEELPYIVPRWQVRAGEVYGRGPGMKALADVKMLQRAMRTQIRGVEKSIDPPNLIADDGIIGPMRINPGSNIYVQPDLMTGSASPVRQMEFTGRLDIGEEFMDRVRARIDARYYKDLLLLPRDPRMPATHILKLEEETATILGPFFGRAQLEGVAPLIWRLFMIRLRAGVYGSPPPQLRGREVAVEYEGAQAKAQRLAEVRAISQYIDIMAPIAQIKPEVMDTFDEDEAAYVVADGLALPSRTRRDARKVAQLREGRRQAQAAANESALANEQASALQSGAQGAAALAGALKTAGMLPNAEQPEARRAA